MPNEIRIRVTEKISPRKLITAYRKAASRAVWDTLAYIEETAGDLIQKGPFDEGTLLGSGYAVMSAPLKGQVGYTAPYAFAVEFGSKPHWPPYHAILAWVLRNLAVKGKGDTRVYEFKPGKGKGFRRLKAKRDVVTAERVARLIQFKIAAHGTRPQPFLRPAVEFAIPLFPKFVEQRVQELV